VAAVSPAMDLDASSDLLHAPRNRIYEWQFLRSLRRRARLKLALQPEKEGFADFRSLRSIREFDDRVTAPAFGFAGAADYYARASASRVAEKISIPTLVIHAKDDPFIRMLPETRAKLLANPRVRLIETEHGGHCAFLAEPNGYDGRWAEQKCIEFLRDFSQ